MVPPRVLDAEAPAPPRAPPAVSAQAPIVESPERALDVWMLAAVLCLVTIGTIEIFSASAVYSEGKHGDSLYFLKRQLIWLGLGMGALYVGASDSGPVHEVRCREALAVRRSISRLRNPGRGRQLATVARGRP